MVISIAIGYERSARNGSAESRALGAFPRDFTMDGTMDDNDRRTHLGFVQNIITRMAGNSFLAKGWSMTLVSAILVLKPDAVLGCWTAYLPLIPALTFWGLDGYFLAQERLYRKLYDAAARDPQAKGWSLETQPMTAGDWGGAAFSKMLLPFHGMVLLVAVAYLVRSL